MVNILFLCVANSARSQMAEGIAQKLLGDIAYVSSAGSHPSKVNPLAIEVLKEMGIDISHQKSKSVNSIDKKRIDVVITLCAEEICPIFPGNVKRIHWPFSDPSNPEYSSDEQLKLFRNVRDDLKDKIQGLRNEVKSWKK